MWPVLPSPLMLGGWGSLGLCWGAAPCLQRLHGANAAALCGAELGGRVGWMEVCTGGAFTLTPLQRCAAPGLLLEGLSPCAGGCSVSVPLHKVTSWEKWGGLAFSQGTPRLFGGMGTKQALGCPCLWGSLGWGLGGEGGRKVIVGWAGVSGVCDWEGADEWYRGASGTGDGKGDQ